jgi:Skp family chaperone for outer membrane proteins
MKLTSLGTAAIFIILFVIFVGAQTAAPPTTQPQAIPIKLAVIDSEAFADPKTGVKRLIAASSQIDTELTPLRQQITTMNTRYQALAQKANARTITQQEADEADTLKRDIQRKQEDGQKRLDVLTRQKIAPILNDLSIAVQAYAKQRGYDIVLDTAKFAGTMIVINQGLDITGAFITDYNAKNPGTAATLATPAKP